MSFKQKFWKDRGMGADQVSPRAETGSDDAGKNPEMERALRNFRLSVHAWSATEYLRPREVVFAPRRVAWRKAVIWALGSVLVAGSAGGGLLNYQHRKEQVRIAAERLAEGQRQIQEQRAEEELAKVDNDVSREVPDALEPLAQLMTSDETQ